MNFLNTLTNAQRKATGAIGQPLRRLAKRSLGLLCLLAIASVAVAKEPQRVTVTDPFAEMHTGPGRGYPIYHIVEKGETISLLKSRTDWYKIVTSKGKQGWVHRRQLATTLAPNGSAIDLAAPDWQDYVERRWEFGFSGSDFSGARGLTTYLGYHLTPNISAELKYTQAFGEFSDSKLISLNAVHQPFPEWRTSPFFTLGTGTIAISPSSDIVQVENRENSVLTVGGGFFVYLSRNFLLRLEYNDHTLLTKRESNEEVDEWKIGCSIFF
ncbi:SH3 domain-containing protein [Teredinibacter waterburyi]|uniref:SH3 domain-containing protein n=1 Tax=Teredinibacter waterburyi TaxID=1500538 RepID=UPI001FEA624E|nr:SH3 domain-containing protein [Teredinibacter waterburyi]